MKLRNKYVFSFMICLLNIIYFNCTKLESKPPLRILFLVDKFPYEPRKYIDNQIVDLIDDGHEVYILADRIGLHSSYSLVEKYNLLDRTFYGNQIPSHLQKNDIIYCQFGGKGNKALKMIEKGLIKGKLVVCFRGGDATKKIKENPHIYDILFKKADLFFPICKHFSKILIKYGCNPKKIHIHYSSIDADRIPYSAKTKPLGNDPIKIITVARLIEYKGLNDSILAISEVLKKYPNIEYEIIGEGIEMENLNNLIKKLGLEKKIKLLGYLSFDQILEKLSKAHLFLFTPFTPYYAEQDAPVNAMKEAMLAGLPVISTNHGGIPELVQNGISGFLVKERDINAIVSKIIYLIENPQRWAILGKAGSDYVRKYFDKKRINKNLIDIFYRLVKK